MVQRTAPQPAKQAVARAFNSFNLATFTIPAKITNTITVTCQLQDARGQTPAGVQQVKVYLSDNADGSTLTATVPTSTLAINTNGVILGILTTNKCLFLITNATGAFALDIVQTAGGTIYYLCVCLPDGSLAISAPITF